MWDRERTTEENLPTEDELLGPARKRRITVASNLPSILASGAVRTTPVPPRNTVKDAGGIDENTRTTAVRSAVPEADESVDNFTRLIRGE